MFRFLVLAAVAVGLYLYGKDHGWFGPPAPSPAPAATASATPVASSATATSAPAASGGASWPRRQLDRAEQAAKANNDRVSGGF